MLEVVTAGDCAEFLSVLFEDVFATGVIALCATVVGIGAWAGVAAASDVVSVGVGVFGAMAFGLAAVVFGNGVAVTVGAAFLPEVRSETEANKLAKSVPLESVAASSAAVAVPLLELVAAVGAEGVDVTAVLDFCA